MRQVAIKQQTELLAAAPDFCNHCEWKPAIPNNKNQEIAVKNLWLIIPIPNSAVWLYVCPKCFNVMANKNAVENVEKIIQDQKRQVQPVRSPLIIPGRN